MGMLSLGKYKIKLGHLAKYPEIEGGVPIHKNKKHTINTVKTLAKYVGEEVEFFIQIKENK